MPIKNDPGENVEEDELDLPEFCGRTELTQQELAERRLGRVEKLLKTYEDEYWCVIERHCDHSALSSAIVSTRLAHFILVIPTCKKGGETVILPRRHLMEELRHRHCQYAAKHGQSGFKVRPILQTMHCESGTIRADVPFLHCDVRFS